MRYGHEEMMLVNMKTAGKTYLDLMTDNAYILQLQQKINFPSDNDYVQMYYSIYNNIPSNSRHVRAAQTQVYLESFLSNDHYTRIIVE